jgi:hypothetical protein
MCFVSPEDMNRDKKIVENEECSMEESYDYKLLTVAAPKMINKISSVHKMPQVAEDRSSQI